MAAVPQAIILKLKKKYPKPSVDPTWLQPCYEWVVNEQGLTSRQTDEIFAHVEIQYLGSDLTDSTLEGSGLPANVERIEKGRIATANSGGPILCQMNAITEIGHSAFNLRNVRQARIDKADLAGLAAQERDEGEQPPQDGEDYTIPPYPRSTLRFVLSDGFRTLDALEYRRLPSVNLGDTPLGCKFILHDVLIRRGIAFLDPESVTILPGTRVEDLDEMRDTIFSRGLRRRMGLPEIDAEEEEAQRAQLQEEAARPQPSPPRPNSPIQAIAPEPIAAARVLPPATPPIQHPPIQDQAPPRTASQRSVTAKADRLLKIQRMLEVDTQPKVIVEDEFETEEARDAYVAETPPAEGSRVNDWIKASSLAPDYLQVDSLGIDDDSFDLSPSQEIAINDAALEQLERDLARCRSPTKRASPVKRAGTSAQPLRGQAPTAVIDLANSDDEGAEQFSQRFSRTVFTSTPRGRLGHPELPKTPDMSDVIDLSD